MSAGSIATAYVEIAPTTKGISGKLGKALGGEADSAGKSSGESLAKSLMGTIGKVMAAAGIGKIIGAAFTEGAALQQSMGGIETLFKDSADTVKGYAEKAYKTTGLSANEYMENVTGFSAGLIASMGGDTAAAAEVANMAMVDMADNANKMGTDMSSIQTAYQGFAKQNYTMLDNLKLGYGGTKGEMERLLADAQKISGVEYNIDNLSDVYEAIHVIQEDLDITGTTSKEAASTFSGSFAAMKASAQNLLGALTTGGNVKKNIVELANTASTFLLGNVLPMFGQLITAIPDVFSAAISVGIPMLRVYGGQMLESFQGSVLDRLPELVSTGMGMLQNIATGIANNLPAIVSKAGEMLASFAGAIGQNLPTILVQGGKILLTLIKGILSVIPQLPGIAMNCISSFRSAFYSYDWGSIGSQIMNGLANGIRAGVGKIVEAAKNAAKSAFEAAKNFLGIKSPSRLFRDQIGKNVALGMAAGISDGENNVVGAMGKLNKTMTTRANGRFDYSVSGGASGKMAYELERIANSGTQIILDSGELVGATVRKYDQALGRRAMLAVRGV